MAFKEFPLNGPTFRASRTTNQSIGAGAWTKIQLTTKDFDTNGCYDPTTNYRFTPNKAGYYLFVGQVVSTVASNNTQVWANLYKNGAGNTSVLVGSIASSTTAFVTDLIYMNGTTDYLELYAYFGTAANALGFMTGIWQR